MKRVALTALLFALLAAPAHATDFVVNTTADPVSGDNDCTTNAGGCTLRDALADAGPTDRVIVPANTYALTQGPLEPNGDKIVGAGARTTIIDAGGTGKAIEVITPNNEVSGVTLRNGGGQSQRSGDGGAILVASAAAAAGLTLTAVTVTGSHPSIPAGGNGGAIATNGTLTIIDSTIAGNLVEHAGTPIAGAVLVTGGTTTIRNTTISGNIVRNIDGTAAQGGGIFVASGALTTQNVTIAGNTANTGTGVAKTVGGNAVVTLNSTLISGTCANPPFSGANNLSDSTTCFGTAPNLMLGGLADNGGPTNTQALQQGSPAIDTGANCPPADQRGFAREGACDVGAYEYQTPPPPPPAQQQGLPDPVAGKTVNALPKSGTVRIKLPGRKRYRVLAVGEQIPVGTTVDVRKGRVTILAAGGQTADFYAGIFKLSQTKGAKPLTTARLVEKLSCKAATTAAKKKRKRRLWGDGSGRFRTKGKHSAATVVGTKWLVEDRCDSTLTRVRRGKVRVRDFVKHKTVLVKAGKRYIARARG